MDKLIDPCGELDSPTERINVSMLDINKALEYTEYKRNCRNEYIAKRDRLLMVKLEELLAADANFINRQVGMLNSQLERLSKLDGEIQKRILTIQQKLTVYNINDSELIELMEKSNGST